MNDKSALTHVNNLTADMKMVATNKKFRMSGLMSGIISGLSYGIYSTLVVIASGYNPLVSAAGILSAPFV
jgi:tetrahydromethanopterin S-methyltransferase subunit F